jgi:transposase InsO family protein
MCQAAGVSRAGFYRDWQERKPQDAEVAIRDAVQKAALRYRRYGYRRVLEVVRRSGIAVGQCVVRPVLRAGNLLAVRKRKFVVTTDSKHDFAVYPNLARYVRVSAINQLWVADITYVRLGREFVYLAVVLDVYSRRVVGWSLGRSLHTSLPLTALNRAIASRQPGPDLVHHSDRGTQYASDEVREAIRRSSNVHQHEPSRTALRKRILREFYAHAEKTRRSSAGPTQAWRSWSRTSKTSLKGSTIGSGYIRR